MLFDQLGLGLQLAPLDVTVGQSGTCEFPGATSHVSLSVLGVPGVATQQGLGRTRDPWTQFLWTDQQGKSTLILAKLLPGLTSHSH